MKKAADTRQAQEKEPGNRAVTKILLYLRTAFYRRLGNQGIVRGITAGIMIHVEE